MAELTVLAWNVAHRAMAWDRVRTLVEEHGVDVALLQEAVPPAGGVTAGEHTWPDVDNRSAWHIWDRRDSTGRRWCSAIAWFGDTALEPEERKKLWEAKWDDAAISHPGQFAVGYVALANGQRAALVSLYGIWDTQPGGSLISSEATLHRAISDLTPLLQSREPVLIAGDLNIHRGYGDAFDGWAAKYDTVFDRLAAYGVELVGPFRAEGTVLEGCPCGGGAECRHVMTRPDGSGRPRQLDWVFARGLGDVACEVLPIDDVFSDHAPILVRNG